MRSALCHNGAFGQHSEISSIGKQLTSPHPRRRENAMKKIILHNDRPMKHISIRVPEDVLEDLKRIAPLKGMGGYQALIKFYISQGLRQDRREERSHDN
jgi:hypothetical protein